MQFTLNLAVNATEEIAAAANFPYIRLFTALWQTASEPQLNLLGIWLPWSVASPSAVNGSDWTYFSAVWYDLGMKK